MNNAGPFAHGSYGHIEVVEAWQLSYCLGCLTGYLMNAAQKGRSLHDLQRAQWYVNRAIEHPEIALAGCNFTVSMLIDAEVIANDWFAKDIVLYDAFLYVMSAVASSRCSFWSLWKGRLWRVERLHDAVVELEVAKRLLDVAIVNYSSE